jgi:hypothetical protein
MQRDRFVVHQGEDWRRNEASGLFLAFMFWGDFAPQAPRESLTIV